MSKLRTAFVAAGCLGLMCSASAAQQQTPAQGLTIDQARMMDADRDGRITQEEFLRASSDKALFARLDTNFDNVLDKDEQRAGIRIPIRTTR